MPLQERGASKLDGRTATTGLRLVLTRAAIVVGARAMLFLLLASSSAGTTTATGFIAIGRGVITARSPTERLVTRRAIPRSKLDLQLNNFVPLLISPITFGDRKKLTQTAAVI